MTTTTIEITPNMAKYKAELPSYREGGYNWQDCSYIGLLEIRNRIKFNRENELEELLKDIND